MKTKKESTVISKSFFNSERSRMRFLGPWSRNERFSFFLFAFFLLPFSFLWAGETKSAQDEALERRQKVEIMSFFLKDPKDAKLPTTPQSIELFNQAVDYYKKQDYAMARQSLKQSLALNTKNAFAYELMGDIDSNEQKLADAKANYEIAFNLEPSERIRKKLEENQQEVAVDKTLRTSEAEHFLIKYHDSEKKVEQFELKQMLRDVYKQISQDMGFYFKNQVVVLLYSEEDFKKLTNMPHWVGGVYDGKVRMPFKRAAFGEDKDLKSIVAHEVTHAFVAAISEARGIPAWINEGLAEYQENKIRPVDLMVFNAAIKTGDLMPIDLLMSHNTAASLSDPLRINLFYQQSFHFVSYLINKYGMFRMKQILVELGKNKSSQEAVQIVLRASPQKLEREWRATFIK